MNISCSSVWKFALLFFTVITLIGCRNIDTASKHFTEPDPSVLRLGKEIYDANCASCHGVDGQGQPNWKTPDENGKRPAPPHDSSGHTWHHADSLLLEIIADGSSVPGSAMIGYKDLLSQEEMEASLAYIKTFWGEEEREFQHKVSQQGGG